MEEIKKPWPTENGHTHNMTVRVPQDVYDKLRERAEKKGVKISKVVIDAIEYEISRPLHYYDPKKGGWV